jgi:predicted nucleic acid-binding protein
MTGIKKEFIDTNVLVYAYNTSDMEKQAKAQTLLAGLWDSERGCLSMQVFQEFYTIVTRKIPNPLPAETAAIVIEDLGNWDYHIPDVSDVLEAIKIQQRNHLSFWDSLIITSAKKLGCEIIWSEDLSHGQLYEGVRVLNPFLND